MLLAPSNPVVSIGTILAVPGIRDAMATTPAPVVGVSPIIGGGSCAAWPTPASRHRRRDGAAAVAAHYGARRRRGLLDGWLVDETDAPALEPLGQADSYARAVPLGCADLDSSAALAGAAIDLGEAIRRPSS